MRCITMESFCKESQQFLDNVYNNKEELLLRRPGGKDLVLICLDEYNLMKETLYLLSTEANRNHFEQGLNEVKQGRTHKVDINSLWK